MNTEGDKEEGKQPNEQPHMQDYLRLTEDAQITPRRVLILALLLGLVLLQTLLSLMLNLAYRKL